MNLRFIFIALLLIILPTDIAGAVAPDNFVTCNGPDCSLCNLAEMANIIIVWLFGVIFITFGVIAVIAGFGLVTSAGNQSRLDAAKSKLTNAVIGLVIVMAAWLLVDTIMRGLLAGGGAEGGVLTGDGTIEGWGPWMEVRCQEQTEAIEGVREGAGATDPVQGQVPPPSGPIAPG